MAIVELYCKELAVGRCLNKSVPKAQAGGHHGIQCANKCPISHLQLYNFQFKNSVLVKCHSLIPRNLMSDIHIHSIQGPESSTNYLIEYRLKARYA